MNRGAWVDRCGRSPPNAVVQPLPGHVKIVLSDDIYIDRSTLPPFMVAVAHSIGGISES